MPARKKKMSRATAVKPAPVSGRKKLSAHQPTVAFFLCTCTFFIVIALAFGLSWRKEIAVAATPTPWFVGTSYSLGYPPKTPFYRNDWRATDNKPYKLATDAPVFEASDKQVRVKPIPSYGITATSTVKIAYLIFSESSALAAPTYNDAKISAIVKNPKLKITWNKFPYYDVVFKNKYTDKWVTLVSFVTNGDGVSALNLSNDIDDYTVSQFKVVSPLSLVTASLASSTPAGAAVAAPSSTVFKFNIANGTAKPMMVKAINFEVNSTIKKKSTPRVLGVYKGNTAPNNLLGVWYSNFGSSSSVSLSFKTGFSSYAFKEFPIAPNSTEAFVVVMDTQDANSGDTLKITIPKDGIVWTDLTASYTTVSSLPLVSPTLFY